MFLKARNAPRCISIGSSAEIMIGSDAAQVVELDGDEIFSSIPAASADHYIAERSAEWSEIARAIDIDEEKIASINGVMIWREQVAGARRYSWHALTFADVPGSTPKRTLRTSERCPDAYPLRLWIEAVTGVDVFVDRYTATSGSIDLGLDVGLEWIPF